MPIINIPNITGLNKKDDARDLRLSVAQELTNLSTTKKIGKLVKMGSYANAVSELIGTTLPSGLTIKNIGEINLTQPDKQTSYIFHMQDGSNNDHLYFGKYWNGSAFQNGLQKLTESEGEYTADAGTTASQIVDSELSSSVNDYYNNWIVTVDRGGTITSAVVQDYIGSTKTLSLTTGAITGLAPGDKYYISRNPVIAYDSASAALTGIDAVDDIIRFYNRLNATICATGSVYDFPNQYQLWFGYIDKIYGTTDGAGGTRSLKGFYLDLLQMLKPYVDNAPPAGRGSVLSASVGGGSGSLTVGVHKLYIAYEYDGGFIGALSDAYNITVASGNEITVTVRIPLDSCDIGGTFYSAYDVETSNVLPPYFSGHLISKRVTGIRLYDAIPGVSLGGDSSISAKLVTPKVTGTNDYINPVPLSSLKTDTDANYIAQYINPGYLSITWVISENPTGNTYAVDVGSVGLDANFKYGVYLDQHFIAANIRNKGDNQLSSAFIASAFQANGVANLDNLGVDNIVNLGYYGTSLITGITLIGDTDQTVSPKRRLLILTEDSIFTIQITSGALFSYNLDRLFGNAGCVAPESIVTILDRVFYVSQTGFMMANFSGAIEVGNNVKVDFDALTNKTDAIGAYFENERLVVFIFPTDGKIFAIDLLNPDFNMFQLSFNDTFSIFLPSTNGNLYASDGSLVYRLEQGDDQNGIGITSIVKSKKITVSDVIDVRNAENYDLVFYRGWVTYNSNTSVNLEFYINGSLVTFNNSDPLPAVNSETEIEFQFPLGSHGENGEVRLSIPTAEIANNTIFEIANIKIECETRRKL